MSDEALRYTMFWRYDRAYAHLWLVLSRTKKTTALILSLTLPTLVENTP